MRGDPAGAAAVVFAVVFAGWVALGGGPADQRELLSDLAPLPVGAALAAAAWRASRAGSDAGTRRAWRYLAAGFTMWWAGDVVWFVLEAVLHRSPFPSPADAGYLGFYPALALGLLALPGAPRTRAERVKVALDALTVLLAAAMVVWYLVVDPVMAAGTGGLATGLGVAYPVGDLVLLYGVVTTLLRRGGRALWLLVGGVAAFVVADVSYARLSLSDSYAGGDWPDAFWMLAEVHCLLAARAHARRPAPPVRAEAGRATGRVSLLPYGAIVLGYGLLVFAGHGHAGASYDGLLLGAAAITGLVVVRQIRVTAENVRLLAELHHLAEVDDLTTVLNRRSLFEAGERLFRRAAHLDRPLAVLMIDVDHFKAVNDTLGHSAGDEVLTAVAARAKAHVRAGDVVGRYGGDELAVVMPDCGVEQGLEVAERIREAVSRIPISTPDGALRASLSIGVAEVGDTGSLADAMAQADVALYRAKAAGRGCSRTAA